MDDGIDADVPLDYATIQVFPNQNRFEAFVCWEEKSEKVAAGILEHLLLHVPEINGLYAKGFDTNFDLRLPQNLWGAQWFSKATVRRFLQVVGFPDLLNGINAIMDEMSQLEESKNFHCSLHGCSSTGVELTSKPEVNMASSDASKSELLRAMDLRLMALSKELVETFSEAVDATCSPKDMTYLANFCQHFGATNIEHSLWKFIELNQKNQVVGSLDNEITTCDVANDANEAIKNPQIANPVPMPSVTPVKYGVSPAKVAQVERQSSTESEESSDSSDEGKLCAERSRTLIRSALPRRSASPMRRVQIGRAGARRAAALTIKSLNFIPARERPSSYRDASANGCEEEGSEKPYKKPEIDVRRITVQDAISLFESKQRDQTDDHQKRRSLTDVCLSTNKSVLRRWSAGMGETSVQSQPEIVAEDPVPLTSNGVADGEISKSSEVEEVSDFISENHDNNEIIESDVKPEMKGSLSSYTLDSRRETSPNMGNEVVKKLAASEEWNQQKQAEFNQILKKMMESKPVKCVKSQPSRNLNPPHALRGVSYDHYKEKRNAKLRGETAGKRVEKPAQSRAMQQTVDKKKAEMASKSMNASKRNFTQKPQKSLTQPESLKETAKPSIAKKTPHKTSPMPATRKSWSSTPSPRITRTSPDNICGGVSSSGSIPTRRRSLPPASVLQPSARKEKPQQQNRNEKETPTANARNSKTEKNQPALANKSQATKTKLMTASIETSAPSKTSLGNKGAKKSSVVPLEPKPFLRKGSGDGRRAGNINKKKNSPQLEESLRKIGNPVEDQKSGFVVNTSDSVSQHSDKDIGTIVHENAAAEPEIQINSYLHCSETKTVDEPSKYEGGDVFTIVEETPLKIETEEESAISPSAWVEIEEEEHLELCKPCEDSTLQSASPTNIALAGSASPRVRHSLSQMLQEECSEPETNEWGNAEIPSAMIYQKDAPKGLKRLLKFARKSKGDTHSTGWSSPSVFSEGEDDGDECKNSTKRNADILLRKTALNTKGYGQPKSSLYEGCERNLAESNLSQLDGKGSLKMQNGRDSLAGATTKASRSFFSLSAFRGNKPL